MKQTLFSRILSLLLVAVLIFSMVPASVFATEADDADSSQSSGIDPPETTDTVPSEETIDPRNDSLPTSEDSQTQEAPSEGSISLAADGGETSADSTGAKAVFVRTTVLLDGGSFNIEYNGQSIVKHGIEILAIRDKGSADPYGTIAYCIEPGMKLGEGGYDGATASVTDAWASLSLDQQRAVALAMLYGAPNGMSAGTVRKQIINEIATAMIIHEICIGWRSPIGKMQIVDDNYKAWNYYSAFCERYDSYIYSNEYNSAVNGATITRDEIDYAYYKLSDALRKHNSLPTFTGELKGQAPTHVMELQSDGTYKIVLRDTDTYSPFKDIDWSFLETEYGLTYAVSGRSLTLSAASFADIPTGVITVEHGDYPSVKESSFIVWGPSDGSGQVSVSVAEAANDPLPMYFKLRGAGGTLKIVKTTSDGNNLAGWKFNIYSDKACTVLLNDTPYVTDENGTITDIPIPVGTVYVKEVGHEDPVIAEIYNCESENPQAVVSVVDGSYEVTFHNAVNKGNFSIVKTTSDGENLEGWQFNFYSDEACTVKVVGPFTSDSGGKISGEIAAGTYWVKEIGHTDPAVNAQYQCDSTNPQEVTLTAGQTSSVRFLNKLNMGQAKIIKTVNNPEAATVEGWTFEIYKTLEANGAIALEYVATATTDAEGTILLDLDPGMYVVYEILEEDSLWESVPLSHQMVRVIAGQTAEVTFTNALRPGSITVFKTDAFGTPLAGAEFLLEWSADGTEWKPVTFTDSETVSPGICTSADLTDGRLVTGSSGVISFTGLYPLHYYRLTETKAPDGFNLLSGYAFQGRLPEENDLAVELTVANAHDFELPMTGSSALLYMPLVGALSFAVSAALLVVSTYRRKQAE